MIAELAAGSSGLAAIRGDGDALPLRDSVCDIVSYATSWHWMNPSRAVPEFRRVLRAGGTFAAYWNSTRHAEAWEQAQQLRVAEACSAYRVYTADPGIEALSAPPFRLPVRVAGFDWARHVPIETHLANLVSRSYMSVLGAEERARYLAAEQSALRTDFPAGIVRETYRAVLVTVRL
jgi:SAM-dependent methyltransferase